MPKSPSFAGKPATLAAFRVNRRPIGAPTLFADQDIPDVLTHFTEMLKPGYPVSTFGHGEERIWRVGGVKVSEAEQMLTGKLGWTKANGEVETDWSDELMDYVDVPGHPPTKFVPFVFDAESRILAI